MQSAHHRSAWFVLGVAVLSLGGGCADPVAPGADLVAGEYAATHFVIQHDAGAVSDLIQLEVGRVDITLRRNGRLAAQLYVPVALSGEHDVPIHVQGRWSLSNGALVLTGSPPTFLDDVTFAVGEDGALHAEWSTGFGEAELTLARRP